jgi:hypothetical protein
MSIGRTNDPNSCLQDSRRGLNLTVTVDVLPWRPQLFNALVKFITVKVSVMLLLIFQFVANSDTQDCVALYITKVPAGHRLEKTVPRTATLHWMVTKGSYA